MSKDKYWPIALSICALLLIVHIPVAATGEWYAEYFTNTNLSGTPAATRYEASLHFEWGTGSPVADIPADNFSVRLSHDEWFEGGTYRFLYRADDGVRLWIGDKLVIDDWRDRQANWDFRDHYVAPGVHTVRVEYYEHTGNAALQIAWEKLSAGATWRADYYNNQNLSGNPILVRNDTAIDFDWDTGSPEAMIPADHFSVRWSRTLGFEAGTYRFYASCDDGVRVFVDGHRVVNAWYKQKLPNTHYGDMALSAGQHTVTVEYFEEGGEAHAHVWWDRMDAVSGWEGRYFDNRELRGGPALQRGDAEINFNWGEASPADWIPSDNFSVVWRRTLDFKPGLYRFNVRSDDGFRLWLDETDLRMDYWTPQDCAWHYQDWHYLERQHTLKLEYFEATGTAQVQLWWDYAATVEAAQAMPPAPTYGFTTAPVPDGGHKTPPSQPEQVSPPSPAVELPGPWQAEYFKGRDLSKSPTVVRYDDAINFDWGWDSPAPEIPPNQFAARWTATFDFDAGRYRFTTTTDDGVRVYVDDKLILNYWRPMRGTRHTVVDLSKGAHAVRVEYFEAMQAASARLSWVRLGASAPAAMTTTTPEPSAAFEADWSVRYYDNMNLSGTPVVTLDDWRAPLDLNWGFASPDAAVPEDYFSASFESTVTLEAGRYRFRTLSDDGVRLYVDDRLVIHSWYPMRGTRTALVNLKAGAHTLRLEYFERGGATRLRLEIDEL